MISNYEIIEIAGTGLSKEEYENIEKKHTYITEKTILDLVNGVGVVARDLNDKAIQKEKGFARVWDAISGNAKKRQNLINKNLIQGLESALLWLQDHDRHLGRIDLRIKTIADELYKTQNEILSFYQEHKELDFRVEMLENFQKNAEYRFELIEQRLDKIESKQQIDIEVAKIGTMNLPIEIEIFTILDNLSSGEFGLWYHLTDNSKDKRKQFEYLHNKLREKLKYEYDLGGLIDYNELYHNIKKIETSEQKAIAFISNQYRQLDEDDMKIHDSIDIVRAMVRVKDENELEEYFESQPQVRTFISLDDFLSDLIEYQLKN